MEKFEHLRPNETGVNLDHNVKIIVDGEEMGNAYFHYFSKPFPCYEIDLISVKESERGKGYGTKIIAFLEDMLKQKGKIGFLHDEIAESSPAKGMYERRGWIRVPGNNYLAYNVPSSILLERLKEFEPRQQNEVREERLWNTYNARKEQK